MKRWLVIAAAALLLLGVAALVGVRVYLGTDGARAFIAETLAAQLGNAVEIDALEVSTFGSSRVRGVRVADGDRPEPFLAIDSADADLSALGILFGKRMPSNLDAQGVRISLRFDASGKLLTTLPSSDGPGGELPRVRVRGGRLTLAQEGRPPLVVDGIGLGTSDADKDNLSGEVANTMFGTMAVTGHVGDAVELKLRGTTPLITPKMLRDLPFVPPAVWQHVEAEGTDVPLELDFTFQSAAPEVRYRVAVGKARVRLLQPDRPAMEVFPAKAVLGGAGDDFRLDGTIEDPYWGTWAVRVTDGADSVTRIDLDTPSATVDQKKLVALPYVPKHVWDEVRAAGKTGAKVAVQIPAKGPVKYRVDLDVKSADVGVTAIDLNVTGAAGRVVVEDDLVKLDKVSGGAGKGRIEATAALDFRKPPSKMTFAVEVKGVDLHELPKKWDLPKQIEGKLSGQANVVVTLRDGASPDLRGTGEARINDAKVAGFPTARPITLSLSGDGRRFRFTPRMPVLSILLTTFLQVPQGEFVAAQKRPDPVGDALGGAATLTRRIADGSMDALRRLAGVERIMRSKETQYLDANVKLEDVDLAELAKRLELNLPFAFEGRLNLEILLGIPINDAKSLRDYRLKGVATSTRLSVAGLEMRDLRARVDYEKGVLRLTDFGGKAVHEKEAGTFAGSARMQVVPRGELTVEGKVDDLPVAIAGRIVPALQNRLTGKASAQGKAAVAVDKLTDPAAWRGTARVTSPDLSVFGVPMRGIAADAELARGKATVKNAKAEVSKGSLTASGSFGLTDTALDITFRLRDADLAGLAGQLPPGAALKGTGDLSGSVKGTLEKFAGGGAIATRGVEVGKVKVGDLAADWSLANDTLRLSKISGALFQGTASGEAEVRLGTAAGKLKVRLEKLDAAALSKAIEGVPIKIDGRVTADVEVDFAPPGGKDKTEVRVEMKDSALRLQGIATRNLRGTVERKGDAFRYNLQGEALGGKISVEGVYPPPPPGPNKVPHGRLILDRLFLGHLFRAAQLDDSWRHLRGVVSLDLPFRFDGPGGAPAGTGRVEARDVRWREVELIDQVRADVRLANNGLSARDVAVTFAGGQLRVSGLYNFGKTPTGWFNVQLTGADAGILLGLTGGDRRRLRGGLDFGLRGEINREWRGTGTVGLSRGEVSGVAISGTRVPFSFTFDPSLGQAQFVGSEGVAQFGQGRAQLRGTVRVGEAVHAEGTLVLFDAEMGALSGVVGNVSSYLRGRISGRVDFSGTGMRSLDDLDANVRATVRDTQALQLPLLLKLIPYIVPGEGASRFSSGEVRGRLSRGVFRIEGMTLTGNVAELFITGTVTTAGRLDLDVAAQRSRDRSGRDLVLLAGLASTLPAAGPVPASLLIRATDALSRFVINLRVTGTIAEPVIRVQPIRILREDSVRFFLRQGAIGS